MKDTHLHCMGFRKTRLVVDYDSVMLKYHMNLYIPQDSNFISEFGMINYCDKSVNVDDNND